MAGTPEQMGINTPGLTHGNSKSSRPLLLLAEELATVPAMVPSFCQGKPHRAARTAVPAFILHPVVSGGAARLVTHRPAEHASSAITNEDPAVIPAGDMKDMVSPWGKPRHRHDHPCGSPVFCGCLCPAGVGVVCLGKQNRTEPKFTLSSQLSGSNLAVTSKSRDFKIYALADLFLCFVCSSNI